MLYLSQNMQKYTKNRNDKKKYNEKCYKISKPKDWKIPILLPAVSAKDVYISKF